MGLLEPQSSPGDRPGGPGEAGGDGSRVSNDSITLRVEGVSFGGPSPLSHSRLGSGLRVEGFGYGSPSSFSRSGSGSGFRAEGVGFEAWVSSLRVQATGLGVFSVGFRARAAAH